MRTILFVICLCLSIKSIDNTLCSSGPNVIGGCGCCSLVGDNCITFQTIDGMAATWHVCVPDYLKDNFTLDYCQSNITISTNHTRICVTKYGRFRLFPQCATKQQCLLPTFRRNYTNVCQGAFAVKGSCKQSFKRYSYDSKRNECVSFEYSGCGPSKNNFQRLEVCEKLCKKKLAKFPANVTSSSTTQKTK